MCKKIGEKEADSMTTATVEYNKDIFLAELEESFKRDERKKKIQNCKNRTVFLERFIYNRKEVGVIIVRYRIYF